MTYQKSPEQIQDEIAETRARMDARLSNLTEQASPTSIAAKMLNMDSSSSGDLIGAIVDRVKANPLAALTIGAGLLGISKTDNTDNDMVRSQRSARADFIGGDAASRLRARSEAIRAEAGSAVDNAKEVASKQAQNVADKASQLGDDAMAHLDDLQSNASDLANQVSKRAREMPQKAKYEAENAAVWVKENPVPASLMALAAGAAIASFLAPKKSTSSPVRDNRALVPEDDELTIEKAAARKRKAAKSAARPAVKTRTKKAKTPRKPRAIKSAAVSAKASTKSTSARAMPATPAAKPLDDMFTDK